MWRQWKCNHMKIRNRALTRNQIEINFYCLSQSAYSIFLGQPEQTKMEGSLPRRLFLVLIGQNNIICPLLCQLLSRAIHSWNQWLSPNWEWFCFQGTICNGRRSYFDCHNLQFRRRGEVLLSSMSRVQRCVETSYNEQDNPSFCQNKELSCSKCQ